MNFLFLGSMSATTMSGHVQVLVVLLLRSDPAAAVSPPPPPPSLSFRVIRHNCPVTLSLPEVYLGVTQTGAKTVVGLLFRELSGKDWPRASRAPGLGSNRSGTKPG